MELNNLLSRGFWNNIRIGIGKTILGSDGRYNFSYDYNPINPRTVFVDVSYNELMSVAQNVPHLNCVISRGAELFSLMRIIHKDANGDEIELKNSPLMQLLNKPNPLRNRQSYFYEWYIMNAIFNNTFQYKLSGIKGREVPDVLRILPSGLIKANLTGKMYDQSDINGIIENYSLLGFDKVIEPDDVLHISEGFSSDGVLGVSKIVSLQLPLSNIMAALKSNNIILTERGMIGFLVSENKDNEGSLPANSRMKKMVSDQYQKNKSLDSFESHVGLFTSQTKWVPMTFDVGQLKLLEGLEDSFGNICAAYGIDRDIFPSVKGATNENKAAGLKNTIQNTIQSLADKLLLNYANEFGLTARGETLEADYSYLPIMQADKVNEGKALFYTQQAASGLLKDGVINHDTYAEMCDVDKTGTGVIIQTPAPGAVADPNSLEPNNPIPPKK